MDTKEKAPSRGKPVLSLMILRKKFVPSYLFSFKLHCREGSCPLRERSRYCNVNLLPAASFSTAKRPGGGKPPGRFLQI